MTRTSGQIRRPLRKVTDLPVTLTRHKVYILPTAHGYQFVVFLLAMLVGSINYNNNLGFLLVFLLGGIMLVSMIYTYRNVVGIKILSVSAQPVFAGKTALFRFLVRAGDIHRRAIAFMIENEFHAIENIIAKHDEAIDVKTRAPVRGVLTPGRVTVWSRYPLGLFRAWTVISPDISCVVYPDPLGGPFKVSKGPGDSEKEDDRPEKRGVEDFSGLKHYQPGDSIKQISWKSLSRGMGLFTKEFSGGGSATVLLDYNDIKGLDMEFKLSRLCDMVLKAHNMNSEYGLFLPGITIPPDKGDRHKHVCLKNLALYGK